MIALLLPSVAVFLLAFFATLLLTPPVRELNRRLGMVDRPDARRINKVPIPRGGGLALLVGFVLALVMASVFFHGAGVAVLPRFVRVLSLAVAIAMLGYADDFYSLPPRLKLLGQMVIAFFAWWWADLDFADLWPSLPMWADCALTMFWIVGAVNAFNLIDGIDGLAAGIGVVAVLGMAGGVIYSHGSAMVLPYLAFAGALLGFLRYNYNPASVFLGDCGSMLIGFVVSTLPILTHTRDSFLVSVGVPLLAMGVPIFDTSLAILRRTLRRLIRHDSAGAAGQVMQADADHLHHRLLRLTGLNQRKTAWILYGLTLFGVCMGLLAMVMDTHAGGLWLAAVAIAAVVIFKDASIELFDAGCLLNQVAHPRERAAKRRLAVMSVPFFVGIDLVLLVVAFTVISQLFGFGQNEHVLRSYLPVRVVSVFIFLWCFRAYRTVWSRAVLSNYLRLFLACVFGSVMGAVFIYYWPSMAAGRVLLPFTFTYAILSFLLLVFVRVFRGIVRDVFYAVDCGRLKREPAGVSRILVYGAGLRYKTFRRELVRTASANSRIIVGIVDDDIYLKGRYIGGIRIWGTIREAPEIIRQLKVDAVVITCALDERILKVVRAMLAETGVKVTLFGFSERVLEEGNKAR